DALLNGALRFQAANARHVFQNLVGSLEKIRVCRALKGDGKCPAQNNHGCNDNHPFTVQFVIFHKGFIIEWAFRAVNRTSILSSATEAQRQRENRGWRIEDGG